MDPAATQRGIVTRIALVCSEPLRPRMAGIGIRYQELAHRLPRPGIEIVVVSAGELSQVPDLPAISDLRPFERGALATTLEDCDGVIAQGQLANDVLLEVPQLPCAIDLYDPWLVENLHYHETLGLDPYRNDHATWVLQLSRGDFFVCSSEEQRNFYLGLLTALGRVNPPRVAADPDLQSLIAIAPFGIPQQLPPHRPILESAPEGTRRLLFGGLYDWYDPWTLLDALALLEESNRDRLWQLLLVRNPNAEATPQQLFQQVEDWCREHGWWGSKVLAVDWVAFERRYDLLRDVDLMVTPHRPSLETRLSLRTRFLDAIAAGCPAVTTEGGAMSRWLQGFEAGWIVPPQDTEALAEALREALDDEEALERRSRGAERLRKEFAWERVLEPLVEFCRQPRRDANKEAFAFCPPTLSPPDPPAFRAKRWLRRKISPS
ncbi:MAG: glycosyltransferase family 4 protein [Deltaproteobacteria bacterium]|nr:glycosyltransferase family 4 protein [Deltaproteobacteria bacterium]